MFIILIDQVCMAAFIVHLLKFLLYQLNQSIAKRTSAKVKRFAQSSISRRICEPYTSLINLPFSETTLNAVILVRLQIFEHFYGVPFLVKFDFICQDLQELHVCEIIFWVLTWSAVLELSDNQLDRNIKKQNIEYRTLIRYFHSLFTSSSS